MTRAEFLKGWDKLLINYPLPRQVWQYQGVPPEGLITPDRFTELYFEEVKKINADEFMAVIAEYIAHSGSKSFPLVSEIKRLHTELFWSVRQLERERQEREQAIKENREAERRYETIMNQVKAWDPMGRKRLSFKKRVIEIENEQVPEMFRNCKVLTDIAHQEATIQAYEEMTNADE